MSDSNRTDDSWSFGRRTALKLTGGIVLGGASAGNAVAGGRGHTKHKCYVKQGGKAYEIEPLEGDVPVEKLYDYRLPSKYEGMGVNSTKGPHYRSVGTKDLQKEATSIMFLYDGPDGLSLVVVHGRPGGKGGSVSWKVTSVPRDAKWAVKDDYYVDADTGEQASSNYDNWETDGKKHHIDWTWGSHGTDGGALSDLGKEFALTIYPAFNKEAELYGKHYSGWVKNWKVLSGDLDDPDHASLELDEPVTVACKSKRKKWDDDHDHDHKDRDKHRDDHDHDHKDRNKHRDDHDHDHKDRDDDHGKPGHGKPDDTPGKGKPGHGKPDDTPGKGKPGKGKPGKGKPDGYQRQHQEVSQTQKQTGNGSQYQSQQASQTQAQKDGGKQYQNQEVSQTQAQAGSDGVQAQSQQASQTQAQSGSGGTQVQEQNASQTQVQKLLNKVTGKKD